MNQDESYFNLSFLECNWKQEERKRSNFFVIGLEFIYLYIFSNIK